MKIAVDVKRVVQEIDLDSGETTNYLVFSLGDAEHVVPATEEQLKRAIIEANSRQDNGSPAHVQAHDNFMGSPVAYEAVPPGEILSDSAELHNSPLVEELLEDPINEQELAQAVMSTADPSVFEDVSGITEEDLAQYQTDGVSTMPHRVNAVTDEAGAEATFAEIMQPHTSTEHQSPSSPRQLRRAAIEERHQQGKPQGQREVIKALRQRAKQVPPRRLAAHEVDEAGNPTVPQTKAPQPAAPPGFAQYADPNAPAVRMPVGPVPAGLAGLDEDGFEQG